MILAHGSLPPADGNEIVPFTMPDNVPVIELTVGSQKVDAHVDRAAGPSAFRQNMPQPCSLFPSLL